MKKVSIAALLFALVLMVPAVSRAHDNDKTVMGNITKVDGMNLMVKGADGKEIMVMMDAKTKITQGAKKVDAKTLKVGDRFGVRIPALADRLITVEVRLIATKGEYASWRATRATGDFDLRTFSIRAYPVDKVPELRPGMSAYVEWQQRR